MHEDIKTNTQSVKHTQADSGRDGQKQMALQTRKPSRRADEQRWLLTPEI